MAQGRRLRAIAAIAGAFALFVPRIVPVVADDSAFIHARGTKTPVSTPNGTSTDRIIVRVHDAQDHERAVPQSARSQPMSAQQSRALEIAARTSLTPVRRMGSGAHVLRLTHDMPIEQVEAIVERLKADPSVAHAEPDRRKFPLLVPTDPLYAATPFSVRQWNLRGAPGGINAEAAWNTTQGSTSTVVAVLDTGILPNLDLDGRLVAGYDLISADADGSFQTANDGSGRDNDPSDPGNWIAANEAGRFPFTDCPQPQESDWHGTHTAGIIAANTNNAYGIAGINWNAKVQPVRVLGKCGGYTSDIIDGLRWAAGLFVPGLPLNPTPAQVINMSLGGVGGCSAEEQAAINAALWRGPAAPQPNGSARAIVTAAGNEGTSSTNVTPGNCAGVITVTATDINGSRAPYANIGSNVALAAPGGYFDANTPTDFGILSLFNNGTTVPSTTNGFAWVIGTSEAAAHVSGVASLVLAAQPNLTPYQMYALLRGTARVFPNTSCTLAGCGTGIADAERAIQQSASPAPDQGINFGGIGSNGPDPAPANQGGGGGGGCTIGGNDRGDWTLALLALLALIAIGTGRIRRQTAPAHSLSVDSAA